MDCQEWRNQFTDYIENTLSQEQRRAVEAHLQSCEACAADLKAFRRAVADLRTLEFVEAPEGLVAGICEAVAAAATESTDQQVAFQLQPAAVASRRRRISWQSLSSIAVAAVLLISFSFISLRSRTGREEGPVLPALQAVTPPGGAAGPGGPTALNAAPASAPAGTVAPQPQAAVKSAVKAMAAQRAGGPAAVQAQSKPGVAAQLPSPASTQGDRRAVVQRPAAAETAPAPQVLMKSAPASGGFSGYAAAPQVEQRQAFSADMMEAAALPASGGVDVQVTPPHDPKVGSEATVTVTVRPSVPVRHAVLTVHPIGAALSVTSGSVVYTGPLAARERRQFRVSVRSSAEGTGHLRVQLRSDMPGVESVVTVALPGFSGAGSGSGEGQIRLELRSTPLRQALEKIGVAGGVHVEVSDSVSNRRVTADFSQGVSVNSALHTVAAMGGARVERIAGGYLVK